MPPSFWTAIFQTLNVVAVAGLLYWLSRRPLGRLMLEREQRVDREPVEAAQAVTAAEGMLREYKEQMQAVQSHTQALLDKAALEAARLGQEAQSRAEAELQALTAKAQGEIEVERQKVLAQIRHDIIDAALLVAGEVLVATTSEDDQRTLWEQLPSIAATSWGGAGDSPTVRLGDGQAVVLADVTVASPMSDELRADLMARLEQLTGRKVRLVTREDPAILGGAKMQIGDTMIDASLAGRLQRLQDFLHEAIRRENGELVSQR